MDDQDQNRETGARKLERRPEIVRPDPVRTGDRGDEPKKPYGLTEPLADAGAATRHYDGKDSSASRRGMDHNSDDDVSDGNDAGPSGADR